MRRELLAIVLLLFPGAALTQTPDSSPHAPFPRKLCAKCAERLSLIQLIANPEGYNGHLVQLEGYVSLEFEDYGLYLSRDDYDHLNGANAVWIEFRKGTLKDEKMRAALNGKWVVIEGVFDGNAHGHMGAFSGTIRDISRIQHMLTRAEYEKASRGEKK